MVLGLFIGFAFTALAVYLSMSGGNEYGDD